MIGDTCPIDWSDLTPYSDPLTGPVGPLMFRHYHTNIQAKASKPPKPFDIQTITKPWQALACGGNGAGQGAGERNDVRPVTDSDAYKCIAAFA